MNLGAMLAGKTVFITGASSGIGAHLAQTCARCGANVVLAARRLDDLIAMEPSLYELGAAGVLSLRLDVADEAAVRAAVDSAHARFGGIDVLVNNAGVASAASAINLSAAEYDTIFSVNTRGAFFLAQAAAQKWRDAKRGGVIVNIVSILAFRQAGGVCAYAMSKAALVQMTKTLALEWARYDIRVNAIAPGYFDTPINAGYFDTDAGAGMIQRVPMRRIGHLGDLDGPFLLLATPASAFMTGAVIAVDGGHLVNSL